MSDNFDILFATKLSTINENLLSSADKLPTGCAIDLYGCTGKLTFGTFSLAASDASSVLLLTVAISGGAVSFNGAAPIDLSGTSATFSVTLEFVSSGSDQDGASLRFGFDAVGTETGGGVVVPSSSTFGTRLTPMQSGTVEKGIAAGLVSGKNAIGYDIAALFGAPGTKAWLEPQTKSYLCTQPKDAPAVFAVLLDSFAEDGFGFDEVSAAQVMSTGADYALALSPYLFMQHVFLGGLAKSLGAKPDDFRVSGDGVIRNRGDIAMASVRKGLITYHPKITSVTAEILDVNILITVGGKCDMGDKITLTFTGVNEAVVGCDAKGALSFHHQDGYPTFAHQVSKETKSMGIAAWIAEWIGGAIGSSIAKSLKTEVTSTHVVKNAPSYVKWAGTGGFAPQAGGLGRFFYLTGNATK